ncbi:MAG: hypothetical protein E6Q36_07755 [Chryseobacterium sp.]|nr:MAG: hypothetical protein E6Q36_07755 [Chryseobacterium sp.]
MKHSFILNNEDSLRRYHLIRTVPFHPLTKLTKFKHGEKDVFVLRNGTDVNFFDFNCETKILGELHKYSLPDPNAKYNFYDHKNEFIYYSRENPDTLYEDFGFYNLQQQKNYFVANSHQGKITGIAHFNENVLVTSSMTG